jgi:hypothetical protein
LSVFTQINEVPFTLEDRDRLIKVKVELSALNSRVDQLDKTLNGRIDDLGNTLNGRIDELGNRLDGRIDELGTRMDGRFDEVNSRIDRLEHTFTSLFMWGFGIVLTAIFGLFGFILYDRRSTIAPVKREHDRVLKVLCDFGMSDEKMKELLQKAALW